MQKVYKSSLDNCKELIRKVIRKEKKFLYSYQLEKNTLIFIGDLNGLLISIFFYKNNYFVF